MRALNKKVLLASLRDSKEKAEERIIATLRNGSVFANELDRYDHTRLRERTAKDCAEDHLKEVTKAVKALEEIEQAIAEVEAA